jgi:uncharacterized protein (UPF0303 family)
VEKTVTITEGKLLSEDIKRTIHLLFFMASTGTAEERDWWHHRKRPPIKTGFMTLGNVKWAFLTR